MQDAIANAAPYIGVSLTQKEMYRRCKPRINKVTTLKEIEQSVMDKIEICRQQGITAMKGGMEYNLLSFRDGQVRIAGAHVENKKYPQGSYERICKHAFIHLAFPLKNQPSPHIGAVIDNTIENPTCLVEQSDITCKEKAHLLLHNFFGGEDIVVRVKFVYCLRRK